jgi:ABC-type uncharacterized transport system substrate-binding protein
MLRPATIAARTRYSQWFIAGLAIASLGLSGCQLGRPTPPQTDPEPVEAPKPKIVQKPAPAPAPAPAPKPLRIAILASCEKSEYSIVKNHLMEIAGAENVEVFELDSSASNARAAVDSLRRAGHDNVVAIGLLAARATHRLDVEKVVFCQVLNHDKYELLGPRRRGVHALPRMDDAAKLLESIRPDARRVAVITGGGHESLIDTASSAFAKQGIELIHHVATSDKETVLELQRLLPQIQGYWLFPDNRVLSRDAIRDVMSLARRTKLGVIANDPQFLQLGAVISASTDSREIAALAFNMLVEARDSKEFRSSDMSWTPSCLLKVNRPLATELGYDLDAAPQSLLAR